MTRVACCVDFQVDKLFVPGLHYIVLHSLTTHICTMSRLHRNKSHCCWTLWWSCDGGKMRRCSGKPDFAVYVNRNLSRLSLRPPQAFVFTLWESMWWLRKQTVTSVIARYFQCFDFYLEKKSYRDDCINRKECTKYSKLTMTLCSQPCELVIHCLHSTE